MIREIESLVRQGLFDQASRMLRSVKVSKIPREEALAHANLARRTGQFKLSLKILNPVVRGEVAKNSPPTPGEKIEYAASLIKVGALTEASGILEEIDARRHPEANLQRAVCFFSQWKYEPAIPLLRAYVESFPGDSYARCVGKVNLAAALVFEEKIDESRRLIEDIRSETQRSGYALLYGNHLELAAQLEILEGNWDQAEAALDEAWGLLNQTRNTTNALYILKWQAIVRTLKSGKLTPDLAEVRAHAIRLNNWETVRDCDFFAAKISKDREALLRLYFGTPHESYRRRILRSLGLGAELPDSLLWTGDRRAGRKILDLSRAQTDVGDLRLSPGQALHRFLILLCEDFYRPVPLVSAFSRIFPGEYFNPYTSANRVYQIIKRFRKWAKQSGAPLEVEELAGSYRLRFTGPFSIRVPRDPLPLDPRELEFMSLRCHLPQGTFAASEVRGKIDGSRATAARLLKWAVEAGKLEASGHGPNVRYKLIA